MTKKETYKDLQRICEIDYLWKNHMNMHDQAFIELTPNQIFIKLMSD